MQCKEAHTSFLSCLFQVVIFFVNSTSYDLLALSSRCTTMVGTNKLVKLEYFQDQREAPEKAAAQRWIHKTHK